MTKCALVTGASSGIGRSVVLALARAGFDVAVNYASKAAAAEAVAAEARARGVRAFAVGADVADPEAVLSMMRRVGDEFGSLDVLVNNAGTTSRTPPADLDGLSLDDWDRVFAVNVRGIFLVTRAAVPLLEKTDSPCIINSCSIVGLRPGPQPLPYAASKAAAVNLTKTLAGALRPRIRVNGIAPGWMEGEWMQRTLGENYERLMERRARATPLGRCVTADDVASSVLSLILHNPFVNGEILVIDGGYTATT
jgi:3-oxoacyl-[acyl-carrier protein] reductase